ncbi:hypothetical protein AAH994_12105 [Weeksellaceae bacterium A-14]
MNVLHNNNNANDPYGFKKKFNEIDNNSLILKFNEQVGIHVWGNARAHYLEALRDEFIKRGFNCGIIINSAGMSIAKKIKLVGNEVKFI